MRATEQNVPSLIVQQEESSHADLRLLRLSLPLFFPFTSRFVKILRKSFSSRQKDANKGRKCRVYSSPNMKSFFMAI